MMASMMRKSCASATAVMSPTSKTACTGSRSTGSIAIPSASAATAYAEQLKSVRDGDRLYILHRGVTLAVRDLTLAAPAAAAATGSDGKVRAAMNGRVVAVLVKQGERVEAGQPVMTLEAMKMEHVHTAPISGTISAIDVAEGEQVTTGKIVVEIEAEAKYSVVPAKRTRASRDPYRVIHRL